MCYFFKSFNHFSTFGRDCAYHLFSKKIEISGLPLKIEISGLPLGHEPIFHVVRVAIVARACSEREGLHRIWFDLGSTLTLITRRICFRARGWFMRGSQSLFYNKSYCKPTTVGPCFAFGPMDNGTSLLVVCIRNEMNTK